MITHSATDHDPITPIATCLIFHFTKPVYNFYNEKSYGVYVKSMEEVIDWSYEFHTQYYPMLNDWEKFKKSGDNIYNSVDRESFLIAWGASRIAEFFSHQKNEMYANAGAG
jgi:hypothetical protein